MAALPSELPSILVVSAYELADLALDVAKGLTGRALVQCLRGAFDGVLDEVQQLVAAGRCDVVLSAGSNAEFLRKRLPVPVISVRVGGFDVMAALSAASEGEERTALVLFQSIPQEVSNFLLGYRIPVELRCYETETDAKAIVQDLSTKGTRSLVGAGLVTRCARERGMRGVFIYSRSSVLAALEESLNIVLTQRTERVVRQRLTAVLHHLDSGVVAVDEQGEIIAANPSADRLTGIALGAAEGVSLQRVLPSINVEAAISGRSKGVEQVRSIGGTQLLVRSNPILDAGRAVGAVFTLANAAELEQSFNSLRAHKSSKTTRALYTLEHIVQASPQMQQVIRRCRTLALHSEASVLISGPTGVGKELLAQGIHSTSKRRAKRFVAVNCGALAPSLLESELFGYEQGAFTGARREGRPGLFEVANEGTVFLDEIGELPLELQTRLLRVLQEKEVTRVGSHEPIAVDVRIISATHRDLRTMVQEKKFRVDLFYRLNVVTVEVPPLKERLDDLNVIGTRMVASALREVGQGAHVTGVEKVLPSILQKHSWPGNVRELQNFAHRVAILVLETNETPTKKQISNLIDLDTADEGDDTLPTKRRAAELAHITQVLREAGGSYDMAAERLGISRSTLWRRLKAAGQ